MKRIVTFLMAALIVWSINVTHAQSYPSRPIRLVVAFAPGGGNDVIARVTAQKLTEALSQAVIVDNRPGGGGNFGAEIVARAAPDGYTLLNISTAHAIAQTLHQKLSYRLERDLAPIVVLGSSPLVMTVHPGVPAKNVGELVAWARKNHLLYASGGVGVISHLSMEMFRHVVAIEATHVAYKGAGPAAADVASGQVHLMTNTMPSVLTLVKAGKLRALGVMTEKRHALLRDVPTFVEQGYKDFIMGNWTGIVAPAATPKSLLRRLATEMTRIVSSPEVNERLSHQGFDPLGVRPRNLGR